MRNLSVLLVLVLFFAAGSFGQHGRAQRKETCPIDFTKYTQDQLLTNPPKNWNYACITKELIDEVLNNEVHIIAVLQCIKDINSCSKPGYEIISDEIINRVSAAGDCVDCTPELSDHVHYGIRELQKRYPQHVRSALAYLV